MADTQREEIAKLEALYAAHPEGRVFTHLADAYRRAGELSRAREILNDGLRRHPDYSSAHVVLGKVLTDQGEPDAALGAFRRVLDLDRHNLVALRAIGDLLVQRGDPASAIGYYRDLQGLDPSDEQLRQTLARIEGDAAAVVSSADEMSTADAASEPEPAADYQDTFTDGSEPVETAAGLEGTGAGWLRVDDSEGGEGPPEAEGELLAGFETFGGGDAQADQGDDWFADASLDAGPIPQDASDGAEERMDTPGFEVLAGFGWQEDAESTESGEVEAEDAGLAAWSFDAEAGGDADTRAEIDGEAEAEGDMPAEFAGESTEPTWTEPGVEEWSGVVIEEDNEAVEWPAPAEFDVAPTPDEAWARVAAFEAGEGGASASESHEAEAEGESTDATADEGQGRIEEEPAIAEGLEEIEAGAVAGSAVPEEASESSRDGEEDAAFQVSRYAAAFLQPAEQPDAGMVTATMADLYARQGFYDRAIQVYRQLLEEVPDDEKLRERLHEVAALQEASRSAAATQPFEDDVDEASEPADAPWLSGQSGVAGAETTPYAWAESVSSDAGGEPTAGDYFARLLSWRPAGDPAAATEPELLELDAEPDWEPDEEAVLEPGGAEESGAGEVELEAGAVAAAFEEWFGTEGEVEAEGSGGENRTQEPEGDADLEMFRSWLQSLKK